MNRKDIAKIDDKEAFQLDMYQLIQVNNKLINRLAMEIHYLNNEVLELGKIVKLMYEKMGIKYNYLGELE